MATPTNNTLPTSTPAARYARSRTEWVPRLQAICDRYDDSMRGHYEWLAQQVVQFQTDKAALVDALRREGMYSEDRLSQQEGWDADAHSVVDGLLPTSLKQLLALVMIGHEPAEHQEPAAAPSTEITTSVSCTNPFLVAANKLGHRKDQSAVKAKTKAQAKAPLTQVRVPGSGGGQRKMASFFAVKEEVRRPQLRPPSPTIHAWEVDAAEYVFEYAPFGPGWFVLRCPRGVYLPAVSFEVHPLGERGQGQGLGLAHFNDRACKYHKHTTYTEEEMMVAYARRVVDAGGDDVTAQWAAESNEHLAETVMRRADKLAKRRQRCKVKVESDVLTAREEALLERIPISTDNAGKAYKAKVRTGSEKKHAAVSGKQRDNGSKPVCGSDDDDSFEDVSYESNGMSSDSSEEEWV